MKKQTIVRVDITGLEHDLTCPKQGYVGGLCRLCEILSHVVEK